MKSKYQVAALGCSAYMKSVLVTLAAVMVTSVASAQDLGVVLGYRSDNFDSDTAGTTAKGGAGNFQAGMIAKFAMGSGPIWIRSGFIYEMRSYMSSTALGETTAKVSYFSVPLGLMYKFSDFGGVFVGPAIGLNVSKSCENSSALVTCSLNGFNSSPISIQLGGSFKIAPQFGFELYYEQTTSKIADGITNPRAVAANMMITFD